jgi:hypothetical protein
MASALRHSSRLLRSGPSAPLSTQVRRFHCRPRLAFLPARRCGDFCAGLAQQAEPTISHPPILPLPCHGPTLLPTGSWGFYGLLNWLPSFFKDHYHVEISQLASFTLLPYLVQGGVGAASGGPGNPTELFPLFAAG